MESRFFSIFLLVLGLFVGGLLTVHMRSDVLPVSSYPLDELEMQENLVQLYVDEQQLLEKELLQSQERLKIAEQKRERLASRAEQNETQRLRMLLGLELVTGDGVRVLLGDGLSSGDSVNENMLVQTSDIRDIVNILFAAGASAISVNHQRVLPLSSINFVGNSFLIDDFHVFQPFTIDAIGSSSVLKARLTDKKSLPDIYKRVNQNRLRYIVTEKEDISISGYQSPLSTHYLSIYASQ
ncbi:MAG: hypothetical protein UY05_C0031G0004 [Candidatus Peregrinibacteria bacterium GW2011_GWA2_47_7]|nr:MAG: hypothetical protein UY05_C0031G0004 [Candidatus Peregrinibacteria bacterium GW2011_GWA2_47_7]